MSLGIDRWPINGHEIVHMTMPDWVPVHGVRIGVGDLVRCIHVDDYPVVTDSLDGMFLGRTRMMGKLGSVIMKLDGGLLALYDGVWELRVLSRFSEAVG